MKKTVFKKIDIGILSINEEAKRFHILSVVGPGNDHFAAYDRCNEYIHEMEKNGYLYVPVGDVFENEDIDESVDQYVKFIRSSIGPIDENGLGDK